MDKFARLYAWFLLVTSGIAAAARLLGASRMANLTSERLQIPQKRARHRLIGIAVIVASAALLPLYLVIASRQAWMPVAAGLGMLSGLEFIANAAQSDPTRLRYQNLIFGFLFAASTLLVYWVLFR